MACHFRKTCRDEVLKRCVPRPAAGNGAPETKKTAGDSILHGELSFLEKWEDGDAFSSGTIVKLYLYNYIFLLYYFQHLSGCKNNTVQLSNWAGFDRLSQRALRACTEHVEVCRGADFPLN
jgi:hypothetical protein